MDFADEGRLSAERGQGGNGIGSRSSGNFAFGHDFGIDFSGFGCAEERHAAFGKAAFF